MPIVYMPCCLYAYLFIYLIPAALFAVNTVNMLDILIPPICVICIAHFFTSLQILYVYMTIKLLDSWKLLINCIE